MVACARLPGVAGVGERLGQAAERAGLADRIADLPEEGERPLTVLDGGLWLVLSAAHRPEADQRLGLTRLVTGVAESGQALTQEVLGQPQISLVEPDLTEAGQRERLCDAGSELPG